MLNRAAQAVELVFGADPDINRAAVNRIRISSIPRTSPQTSGTETHSTLADGAGLLGDR